MRIGFVVIAVVCVIVACGGNASEPGITVPEAIRLDYQREEEPCGNRLQFPDLYVGVPFHELGNGLCAFYYPPGQ